MKKLFVVLTALALFACNDQSFEGTLNLRSDLNIASPKGQVVLPVGSRAATIQEKDGDKLIISTVVDSTNLSAEIDLSKSIKPDANGNFVIPAAVSKQSFDLQGRIVKSTSQTAPQTYARQCQVGQRPVGTSCRWVSEPRECHANTVCGTNALGQQICKEEGQVCTGGGSHQECYTQYEPVYGTVMVTSYDEITSTRLDLAISDAASKESIGSFAGEDRKVHTVGGGCY